jgi:transcriptional regulator with XRE-family HTH domain
VSRWAWELDEDRHYLPADVGRLLARARRGLGLSQGAVAARVGISRPFLTRLEAGQRAPSVAVAVRLAFVLQLSDRERGLLLGHAQLAGQSSPYRTGAWT